MLGFRRFTQSLLQRPTMMWASSPDQVAASVFTTFWRGKCGIKTNKSAAKRFRVRGNGSLKRNHAGASHNTGHKSRGRKNRLRQSGPIKEPKIEKRMQRLIRSS